MQALDLEVSNSRVLGPLRHWIATLIIEWWLIELLSWVVSASCTAITIAVLWTFDGQPLPKLALGLTINGLISLFSNVAKSAMIFPTAEALGQLKWAWFRPGPCSLLDFELLDTASRGPWGSIVLLLRSILPQNREVKRMTLACLGAVLIILALPFELFIQQLVQTPTVWIAMNPPGTVSRTIQYSTSDPFFLSSGAKTINPDLFLQNAVVPMFFSNASVPGTQFSCPTSNCTWPPFQTLGVCSACKPLPSQYLTWRCLDGPADWLNKVTLAPSPLLAKYPNTTACGYFLNSTSTSRVLMTGYAVNSETFDPGEALTMRLFPLVDGITRSPYYDSSIMFQDVGNRLSDFLIVATPGGAEGVYQNVTPIAQECVLSWCVQTMQSRFYWGHLNETVIDTWQNNTIEPFPWNVTTNATTGIVTNFAYTRNITLTPPGHNITFGLSQDTMVETSFTMDVALPSFLTAANRTADPLFKFNNQNGNPRSRIMKSNPWLSSNNISSYAEIIAQVLTRTIRNTEDSAGSVTTFAGNSWESQVQVRIAWPWVVLPLSMLVLSFSFLLATILKSGRDIGDVGVWKTSTLAILFNGLEYETMMKTAQVRSMGDMRRMARDMNVRLVPDQLGGGTKSGSSIIATKTMT